MSAVKGWLSAYFCERFFFPILKFLLIIFSFICIILLIICSNNTKKIKQINMKNTCLDYALVINMTIYEHARVQISIWYVSELYFCHKITWNDILSFPGFPTKMVEIGQLHDSAIFIKKVLWKQWAPNYNWLLFT